MFHESCNAGSTSFTVVQDKTNHISLETFLPVYEPITISMASILIASLLYEGKLSYVLFYMIYDICYIRHGASVVSLRREL